MALYRMATLFALSCALAAHSGAHGVTISLHKTFSDSMVLQAEAPRVYGTGPPGTKVFVAIVGNSSSNVTTQVDADGNWSATMPEQPASNPMSDIGFMIKINADCADCNLSLSDVLFGDVWVCGGQSNMEFSVAEMFDRDHTIETANIPGLRLFAVQKNASDVPVSELIDVMYQKGWVRSSPETVCGAEYNNDGYNPPHNTSAYCGPHCGPSAAVHSFHRATWGYFSAVCYVYGRALLRDTGRPQGLIESCWGGTSIEKWSPPNGDLYNGMISPLLQTPIRGAIWYQGEANAGRANPYADQMREMIQSWRDGWQNPASLKNFTFVLHQLSACTYGGDVPALRWSQQGAVAPWSTLPKVAMSVGLDLSDPTSPCANVHIRNKTAVGERMALAARAVSYGNHVAYTGPVATSFSTSSLATTSASSSSTSTSILFSSASLVVTFMGATLPLGFQTINQTTTNDQGFEISYNGTWEQARAHVVSSTVVAQVSVDLRAGVPEGVRYAWQSIPSSQLLFDSATVATAANLWGLPAPPFWANCTVSTGACALITPGFVPGGGPPGPAPPAPPAPSKPQCPQPLAPTSGSCAYENHTIVTSAARSMKKVDVALDNYTACCEACKANTMCHTATMTHGPKSAAYDFCFLYAAERSELKTQTNTAPCPNLDLVITPN